MPHFLTPLLKSREPHGLKIGRTGAWLAHRLEPAFDSQTRKRGLLGRDALERGTALVIAPSQAVHTFGMRFPIDVVAISRDGRVVKWRSSVARSRIVFALSAFAIVELPAGTCESLNLQCGDHVHVLPNNN